MTERFIVKTETTKGKLRSPINASTSNLNNFNSLPSKREPDDEFNELGEVPFNILIEDTLDEPGKTVAKAAAIALGADDDLQNNFDQVNYFSEVKNNCGTKKTYNSEGHCNNSSHNESSDSENTFDGEAFMNNILKNKNNETINVIDSNASKINEESRRITRSSKRERLVYRSSKEDISERSNIKRRRGRPKKGEQVAESEMDRKRSKDKHTKTEEEQDAYKAKMKEIDDQISRYMSLHCEVCNLESENFAGLRAHMREAHNIKKGYAKCCNKKFLKRALLLDHIRQHLDPDCYR